MATSQPTRIALLLLLLAAFTNPAHAFGAGFVARGSSSQGTNYRHGDILNAVYFLNLSHSILVKQIYFGNWLRDFSQLLDRKAMEVIPEPILRAVVAVFAFIQFGYTTREFEVTTERLGTYRPEEHIDNPKGYEGGIYSALRVQVQEDELHVEATSGMKNYIANSEFSQVNGTSLDYIEKQLVAAIACGRAGDSEAYLHLGSALHTLEDFVAHSNWVELCLRRLGQDKGLAPGLSEVFSFVGGAATIDTPLGKAPPLVTGTFGALDLYQTLLGEIGDKVSAMSLPGLQIRSADRGESIQGVAKVLIGLLANLEGSSFDSDITKITKSATDKPADWGKLNETPQLLWQSLEPVFLLRDKIVRWVYEHLTLKPVADAIAAISTALDKLVYLVIGVFLGPVLKDISKALQYQADQLLIRDQQARMEKGEQSIFDERSKATDPTHSQLCKDHYDHDLNELAGRVASKIATFTIKRVVTLWQPGMTTDVRPVLTSILEALHHPYKDISKSEVQSLMLAEVVNYCTEKQQKDPTSFAQMLQRLDKEHMAAKLDDETQRIEQSHIHKPVMTETYTGSDQISRVTAHDLTTVYGDRQNAFVQRVTANIEKGFPKLDDLLLIKDLLKSNPSSETPNPIDKALTLIPGASLLSAFEGIGNNELRSAPGMGNILKDAVFAMRLNDPEWLAEERVRAKEMLSVLEQEDRGEMLRLLDIKAKQKSSEERPTEESKARRLMNKLKVGSSS